MSNKPNIVVPKKNMTTVNDIFFPKQRDQLFWCFYVILQGQIEYDILTSFFTLEKETKYKWIEVFRGRKELFKPIKVSRNVVEDELANAKAITMATVKALCHLNDVNVFYVDDKKYYEITTNSEKPFYLIEKVDGRYGLKEKIPIEKVEYYREHYWKLENLDKPLKAVSSYKASELKDICKRLHIESSDMTKPKMYEKILSKL
jgi:DNA-binding Xre family transcriptional regulator